MRSAVTIFIAMAFGFFIGMSFPSLSISQVLHFSFSSNNFLLIHSFKLIRCYYWHWQLSLPSGLLPSIQVSYPKHSVEGFQNQTSLSSLLSDQENVISSTFVQSVDSCWSGVLIEIGRLVSHPAFSTVLRPRAKNMKRKEPKIRLVQVLWLLMEFATAALIELKEM